jgi:hypothetical protein
MYLLYVDESGNPGAAGSRFLILGAAAVFEPQLSRINPGKWHGVKYLGNDAATRALISSVWS